MQCIQVLSLRLGAENQATSLLLSVIIPVAEAWFRTVSRYATCRGPRCVSMPYSLLIRSWRISMCNSPIPHKMVLGRKLGKCSVFDKREIKKKISANNWRYEYKLKFWYKCKEVTQCWGQQYKSTMCDGITCPESGSTLTLRLGSSLWRQLRACSRSVDKGLLKVIEKKTAFILN